MLIAEEAVGAGAGTTGEVVAGGWVAGVTVAGEEAAGGVVGGGVAVVFGVWASPAADSATSITDNFEQNSFMNDSLLPELLEWFPSIF